MNVAKNRSGAYFKMLVDLHDNLKEEKEKLPDEYKSLLADAKKNIEEYKKYDKENKYAAAKLYRLLIDQIGLFKERYHRLGIYLADKAKLIENESNCLDIINKSLKNGVWPFDEDGNIESSFTETPEWIKSIIRKQTKKFNPNSSLKDVLNKENKECNQFNYMTGFGCITSYLYALGKVNLILVYYLLCSLYGAIILVTLENKKPFIGRILLYAISGGACMLFYIKSIQVFIVDMQDSTGIELVFTHHLLGLLAFIIVLANPFQIMRFRLKNIISVLTKNKTLIILLAAFLLICGCNSNRKSIQVKKKKFIGMKSKEIVDVVVPEKGNEDLRDKRDQEISEEEKALDKKIDQRLDEDINNAPEWLKPLGKSIKSK
ncbi:hypothetical protein GF336_05685 [Candidatus Woesearchaeota archaeon]|nr:hypothetical protein [Candidatus Woesearchaeota archaeon]